MTVLIFWWLMSVTALAYAAGIEPAAFAHPLKYPLLLAGNGGVCFCGLKAACQLATNMI